MRTKLSIECFIYKIYRIESGYNIHNILNIIELYNIMLNQL